MVHIRTYGAWPVAIALADSTIIYIRLINVNLVASPSYLSTRLARSRAKSFRTVTAHEK